MILYLPRFVQQLLCPVHEASAESCPSTIGHITLDAKQTGTRIAGNPHAACDEAGTENGFTVRILMHSQRNGEKQIGWTYGAPRQSSTLLLEGVMETAASFEVRLAPWPYSTFESARSPGPSRAGDFRLGCLPHSYGVDDAKLARPKA